MRNLVGKGKLVVDYSNTSMLIFDKEVYTKFENVGTINAYEEGISNVSHSDMILKYGYKQLVHDELQNTISDVEIYYCTDWSGDVYDDSFEDWFEVKFIEKDENEKVVD